MELLVLLFVLLGDPDDTQWRVGDPIDDQWKAIEFLEYKWGGDYGDPDDDVYFGDPDDDQWKVKDAR